MTLGQRDDSRPAVVSIVVKVRWLAVAVAVAVIGAGGAAALIWGQGARASNPFAIRRGMSVQQVRRVAGSPDQTYVEHLGEYERIRGRDLTHGQVVRTEQCWFYMATKKNTSYDGAGGCFFRGRVLDVTRGVHG